MRQKKTPGLVFCLSALMFFYGFFLGGHQFVIADIAADFHISIAGLGALVSAQHITAVVMPVVMGVAADKWGKKRILVCFALVFVLGAVASGFSESVGAYVLSACMIGAGYSVCETLCSAVCMDLDPERGQGYINISQCLLSVGAVSGPILVKYLPDGAVASWREMYFLCAVAFTLTAVCIGRMPFPAAAGEKETGLFAKSVMTSPIFFALFAGIVIYVGMESGFGYFVDSLFESKADAQGLGAFGISAYWAAMAVSRLIYSLYLYQPGKILRFSFLGAAAVFVLLIFSRWGGTCILLSGAVGFCYGPIWSTFVACAAAAFPHNRASAVGIMSAGCGLGGIIYPAVIGIVADRVSLTGAFLLLACSACVGFAISFAIKK